MVAEVIILIMALIFFILCIVLFMGKGAFLISGYNTMSKEEQNKYDKKKLCRAVAVLCLVCSIMLCIMAYLGYKVDTGVIDEDNMGVFGIVFVSVLVLTLGIVTLYINTRAKNKLQ